MWLPSKWKCRIKWQRQRNRNRKNRNSTQKFQNWVKTTAWSKLKRNHRTQRETKRSINRLPFISWFTNFWNRFKLTATIQKWFLRKNFHILWWTQQFLKLKRSEHWNQNIEISLNQKLDACIQNVENLSDTKNKDPG